MLQASQLAGDPDEVTQAALSVFNGPLRVTHGASETKAFGVSSVFAEFTLGGNAGDSAYSSVGGTTTFKFDLPPEKSIMVGANQFGNLHGKN